MADEKQFQRLRLPIVHCKSTQTLVLDNYIISELFFREDHPEYFTEEERTFAAIVKVAAEQRRKAEAEFDDESKA